MPVGAGIAVAGVAGSVYAADRAEDAASDAAGLTADQATQNQILNQNRFEYAKELMQPWVRSEEAFLAQLQGEMAGRPPELTGTGRYDIGSRQRGNPAELRRFANWYQTEGPGATGEPYIAGDTYIPAPGQQIGLPGGFDAGGAFLTDGGVDPNLAGFAATAPDGTAYVDFEDVQATPEWYENLGTAYMETPAYQAMQDEARRIVEGSQAAQGMFNSGNTLDELYRRAAGINLDFFRDYADRAQSRELLAENRRTREENINEQRYANYLNTLEQRDVRAQNINEQRYTNYINTLQNLASPTARTNLAALGVNQGLAVGNQNAMSVAAQNQYNLGAVAAQNAAISDVIGAGATLGGAYLGRPQQTTGTIGTAPAGSGTYTPGWNQFGG